MSAERYMCTQGYNNSLWVYNNDNWWSILHGSHDVELVNYYHEQPRVVDVESNYIYSMIESCTSGMKFPSMTEHELLMHKLSVTFDKMKKRRYLAI